MRRILAVALLVGTVCLGAGCAADPHLAAPPWWMPRDVATDLSTENFTERTGQVQAPAPNGGTPSGPTR
jgi:hypothetical protein